MTETFLWMWISLVAFGQGAFLLRLFKIRLSAAFEIACALGLGFGLWTFQMILLGFAQIYYSGILWIFLLLFSTALIFWLLSLKAVDSLRSFWSVLGSLNRFELFCLLLCLLIGLRNYLGALTPEIRHDVLDYHINFPNLYVLHRGFYHTPWHVFSYMPSNVETLYSLALLLSSDILAKLIHFGCSLICTLCIYGAGERYFGRTTGLWAALLWLLLPIVAYEAGAAYIDLGVSMWQFLSLACLLRFFESRKFILPLGELHRNQEGAGKGWLILCGIFSGLALGSKFTVAALYLVPLILTLILLTSLSRKITGISLDWKTFFTILITIGAASFLLVLPWLLRSFLYSGNPIYPFFNDLLGLRQPWQLSAEQFMRDHAPSISDYRQPLSYAFHKYHLLTMGGTQLIALAVLLIPLSILRRFSLGRSIQPEPGSQQFLLLFLGIFFSLVYLIWTYTTDNMDGRFMMPSYLVLCLLVSHGYLVVGQWFSTISGSRYFKLALPVVITLLLGVSHSIRVYQMYDDLGESLLPVLSRDKQERYLQKRFENFEVIQYINNNLPQECLILGIGYPVKRPYVSHIKHGWHPLGDQVGNPELQPEDLLEILFREGFTHLVMPGSVILPSFEVAEMERAGFKPLYQSASQVLYELPATGNKVP